jgi:hypothetical protein
MSESTVQDGIRCTAFNGTSCVASGDLRDVAVKVKAVLDAVPTARVLIFNDLSGDLLDFDFRGTAAEIARRAELMAVPPAPARGPGRPRLGVVAREVTLLPRHWDWLATQPGGASVALRRLVEEARRTSGGKDRVRRSQAAAYKFMVAMAGDAPGFEEATRALFAGNMDRFNALVEPWPADVRDHARALATGAFPA